MSKTFKEPVCHVEESGIIQGLATGSNPALFSILQVEVEESQSGQSRKSFAGTPSIQANFFEIASGSETLGVTNMTKELESLQIKVTN